MKDIIEKISSYNLFNYLFPGIVFAVIVQELTRYSLLQNNIAIGVFVYYFIGLVISRFGSLIIEPILKKINFVNFVEYSDFISASKNDDKIELLSEVNNMYRTVCSLFVILLFIKAYEALENALPCLKYFSTYLLLLGLLIIFLFSYKKQTNYINKRVITNR